MTYILYQFHVCVLAHVVHSSFRPEGLKPKLIAHQCRGCNEEQSDADRANWYR